MGWFQSQGQTGIIDQDIYILKFMGQACQGRLNLLTVTDIQFKDMAPSIL
jgi:hypothetical protein